MYTHLFRLCLLIFLCTSFSGYAYPKHQVRTYIKCGSLARKILDGQHDGALEDAKYLADKGEKIAWLPLGYLYFVQKDLEQAKYWLQKAALADLSSSDEAQFLLGTLYTDYYVEHFEHIPVDYEKALYWLTLASKKDNAKAQFFISQLYYTGKGETIPQNYLKCAYWLKKSAIGGYASGQYLLGLMFMRGEGIDQDHEQGFYWIKKAARQGMPEAEYKLAQCYIDGIGTSKDYQEAKHLLTKLAKAGNQDAIEILESRK